MSIFGKKNTKGGKAPLNIMLCNSSILTSELIESALRDTDRYKVGRVYTTQFSWDALNNLRKDKYDYLFIDEETETKRDIEVIMDEINRMESRPKIILLATYVSNRTSRMLENMLIDTYILMPFQPSHIINTIDSLNAETKF